MSSFVTVSALSGKVLSGTGCDPMISGSISVLVGIDTLLVGGCFHDSVLNVA